MQEEGLSPKEATRSLRDKSKVHWWVLPSCYLRYLFPMAFFGGSTGAIYRQFSVTIVSVMVLSVFVALILTPALCATLLNQSRKAAMVYKQVSLVGFNRVFEKKSHHYTDSVSRTLRGTGRYLPITS